MTAIHIVGQPSLDSNSQSSQQSSIMPVLAIVFALTSTIIRIVIMRWGNPSLSDLFRMCANSQQPYGPEAPNRPNYGLPYPGIQLTPLPAYRANRRTCAADIDPHGRHLGPAGEDGDGEGALPACDNFDRPPKYHIIEADWSHDHLMGQSSVTPSPEREQSGMAHLNNTNRAPGDNSDHPFDDTHDMETPSDSSRLVY